MSATTPASGIVSGSSNTPVSVDLDLIGLGQGATINYRIRVFSNGGQDTSNHNSFMLDILSGFQQARPFGSTPDHDGTIIVNNKIK